MRLAASTWPHSAAAPGPAGMTRMPSFSRKPTNHSNTSVGSNRSTTTPTG